MQPLLSLEGFAERRGVPFDPTDVQALRSLQDASGLVRAYCGQTISLVVDDVVELRGNWTRRLYLPERPVVDVTAVSLRFGGNTISDIQEGTWIRRGHLLELPGSYWGGDLGAVSVTYSHGYADIPEELFGIVNSVTARALRDPAGDLISETIVDYAYTRGTDAQGRPIGVTANELVVLDRFKPAEEVSVG